MHLEASLNKASTKLRHYIMELCQPSLMETMEICLNSEQMQQITDSLQELRAGHLVTANHAFADLD
jgi:hypothetical protein